MRMVVDFADLDRSLANITVGQSGHRLSSHYRDQWTAHYTGRGLPMHFGSLAARATLTITPARAAASR
jgi:acyl-homoserine lactone acylase PvdQ